MEPSGSLFPSLVVVGHVVTLAAVWHWRRGRWRVQDVQGKRLWQLPSGPSLGSGLWPPPLRRGWRRGRVRGRLPLTPAFPRALPFPSLSRAPVQRRWERGAPPHSAPLPSASYPALKTLPAFLGWGRGSVTPTVWSPVLGRGVRRSLGRLQAGAASSRGASPLQGGLCTAGRCRAGVLGRGPGRRPCPGLGCGWACAESPEVRQVSERPLPGPGTAKGQAARLRSALPLLKVTRSGLQAGVGPASCEWSRGGGAPGLGLGLEGCPTRELDLCSGRCLGEQGGGPACGEGAGLPLAGLPSLSLGARPARPEARVRTGLLGVALGPGERW